jgi:hypothetical protein
MSSCLYSFNGKGITFLNSNIIVTGFDTDEIANLLPNLNQADLQGFIYGL